MRALSSSAALHAETVLIHSRTVPRSGSVWSAMSQCNTERDLSKRQCLGSVWSFSSSKLSTRSLAFVLAAMSLRQCNLCLQKTYLRKGQCRNPLCSRNDFGSKDEATVFREQRRRYWHEQGLQTVPFSGPFQDAIAPPVNTPSAEPPVNTPSAEPSPITISEDEVEPPVRVTVKVPPWQEALSSATPSEEWLESYAVLNRRRSAAPNVVVPTGPGQAMRHRKRGRDEP